ncbi:hypothetical protein O181_078512 [Austropuccinia psidii MF-1]|uniref:Uncharacterized protein n=1 Tax=Austropuccinia psidii MF-1 TaxID=1389203 RepID=A0A9Q3IFN7_9BASI|nr:hypothetical protein [Austropuccinia psidii MF-1]
MEWLLGHIHGLKPQIWPSGHILLHWPFWPISNLTKPQGNTPKFGPGGHPVFQGLLAHPLLLGSLWPTWHMWAIKAPTASTSYGLWHTLGPFWTNSNGAKGKVQKPQILGGSRTKRGPI